MNFPVTGRAGPICGAGQAESGAAEKPKKFVAPAGWDADIFSVNPIFSQLAAQFPLIEMTDFPSPELLTCWLHQHTELTDWRFVSHQRLEQDGRYYEDFIFETKQIPMRERNWHDFFGALIWCLFPRCKTRLNAMHRAELQQHGQQQRTKVRHKLTLLDECGVILCLPPDAWFMADLLRQHQWSDAFFQHRALWQKLQPLIFGHANYEMATRPFIGLTAKLWLIPLSAEQAQQLDTLCYSFVDQLLEKQLANPDNLLNHQQLTPLPLLGIPGWFMDQNQAFYQNTNYFRPKRT